MMGVQFVIAVIAVLAAGSASWAQTNIRNGDFEAGVLAPWEWRNAGDAKGVGQIDPQVAHAGRNGFRLSTRSKSSPNVFTVLQQTVAVKPSTNYRIGAWVKGRGVGYAWLGGGHGWQLREVLPIGDFDWQYVTVDVSTHPKETQFPLLLVLEDVTDALWVDDVEMMELDKPREAQVYTPRKQAGVTPGVRFYPALHQSDTTAPITFDIGGRASVLRARVRTVWSESHLSVDVQVTDPTNSTGDSEFTRWDGDQVVLAIDTRPGRIMEGYDDACHEIAFAVADTGNPQTRVLAGKPTLVKEIQSSVERSKTGYVFKANIPWRSLSIDPKDLPAELGINLRVVDGANPARPLQWAGGMTPARHPDQFARLALVRTGGKMAHSLRLSADQMSGQDWVSGTLTRYAVGAMPAAGYKLKAVSARGQAVELGTIKFAGDGPNSLTQVDFVMTAQQLSEVGAWRLKVEGQDVELAGLGLNVFDSALQLNELQPRAQARLETLRKSMAEHAPASQDLYLKAATAVTSRALDRISSGTAAKRQTTAWSVLQLQEVELVLGDAERRLAELRAGSVPTFTAAQLPPVRALKVRDGALYTEGESGPRPVFLSGYVGWGEFMQEYPSAGANLAHRDVLPWTMTREGTLNDEGRTVLETMKISEERGIVADLLMAPHCFPQWAIDESPELTNIRAFGFLKHNIDHPTARRVQEQWLRTLLRMVKDSPALGAICLSNEPMYVQTGRDPWSRPYWVDYLKRRYGSVRALNECYGTAYVSFDNVPVPDPAMPTAKDRQRLYYDWCRFNQEHFAKWHAGMNQIIKSYAPHVLTHAKIMFNTWDQDVVCSGIDPELMTQWADLAGNDAYALWSPEGVYAYRWQQQQAWYDLLHSFGRKPVYNSENHLIFEGRQGSIPSQQTYAVLWQGAMHHQAMTSMWVWGEADTGELRGNISLRPANLYAACRATLDLNRLAPEVVAVSTAKPRVAILHSFPSIFWQSGHKDDVLKVYTGLTFAGQPVRFITERQLQSEAIDVDCLIIPRATHASDAAVDALQRYLAGGGKVLRVGQGCLERDDYDRPRSLAGVWSQSPSVDLPLEEESAGAAIADALRKLGLAAPALLNVTTERPAWGVEYRVVPQGGGTLVAMTNLLHQPMKVKLDVPGHAIDLLSGQPVDLRALPLESMLPRLIRVTAEPSKGQ